MVTFVEGAVGRTYDDGRIIVAGPTSAENAKKYFSTLHENFRNVVILKHEGHAAGAAAELANLGRELGEDSLIITLTIRPQENKSVIGVIETMSPQDFCGDLAAHYKSAPLDELRADLLDALHRTEDEADYNREIILKIGNAVFAPSWHPDAVNWQTTGDKTILTTDRMTFTRNMKNVNDETMTTAFAFEKGAHFIYRDMKGNTQCKAEPDTALACDFNGLCGFSGLKVHASPSREIDGEREPVRRPAFTIECYAKKNLNFVLENPACN